MTDWETTRKCGCPAGRNVLGQPNDFDPCPVCTSVEKINALAEDEAEYWVKEVALGADRRWGAHWAYIDCAEIVIEEFDE